MPARNLRLSCSRHFESQFLLSCHSQPYFPVQHPDSSDDIIFLYESHIFFINIDSVELQIPGQVKDQLIWDANSHLFMLIVEDARCKLCKF